VRQARLAGHDATLLLLSEPSGWLDEVSGLRLESLRLKPLDPETPRVLVQWLANHPQDLLLLNGIDEADPAIPYLPSGVRCVYAVHDTAQRYWKSALEHEKDLSAIVAVSQTVARQFADRLEQKSKLHVIHNGSLLPALPDTSKKRADDLIFLGGSVPAKGAYDLLSAWPVLVARGFNGRLHCFGNLEEAFEARIRKLPEAERITIYGRTRREVIFEQAAVAKILLMLSRVEPFGMATVEAMGMGCVPIAWDIDTGTKEIATAESGVFVPLGDFEQLAREALRVCAEHEKYESAVIQRARQSFSENVMWDGYAKLFTDLMSRPAHTVSLAGERAASFVPATRFFQLLPAPVRAAIRNWVGRSARLGYLFRDLRGR